MGTRKPLRLKAGRPPTAPKRAPSLSSKATRTTIRSFHALSKRLAQATRAHDETSAQQAAALLSSLGGLSAYQAASRQGQAQSRGGDSSAQLLRWLSPHVSALRGGDGQLRLLEVGAVSARNACARSGAFAMTRIDLRATEPGILSQDFMLRPRPAADADRFDVLSLSLVLNFVPDPAARGEMLRRCAEFLRLRERASAGGDGDTAIAAGGLLFVVLPAPCVVNSRYCNDERLAHIFASLGFALLRRTQTPKLVYYLWQRRDRPLPAADQNFPKVAIGVRSSARMNNFSVVLEPPKEEGQAHALEERGQL